MNKNTGESGVFSLFTGVPLRRILVALFLLQILLAVGLTGYLSIHNGQKAVNEVASELRYEVASRVEQKLQTYFSTLRQELRGNQNIIDIGLLKMENLATWESYLIKQLEIFPDAIALTASNEQQEHLAVEKLNDRQFLLRFADKSTGYDLYTYKIDSLGQRTQLPEVIKNYDVRSRPDYQAAVTAKKFNFSQIFTPLTEPTLLISASLPIYNSQGQLLGVNSAVTHISQIGDLLQNIKVGKSGQVFIIERSGLLVASSTTEKPFRLQNGKPIRLPASQSENSLTQASAKYLTTKFSNFDQIQSLQQLDFSFEGKQQFLEIRPLEDELNVNWLIVVAVPEADFMGQIDRNTQTIIFLCLGALGLATLLGIITARWITQPILYFSTATKDLADFTNGKDSMVVVQGIKELEVLGASLNEMMQQLRKTFTAQITKNEELELQVKQRTQELQQEIQVRINSEQKLEKHHQMLAELANHRAISEGKLETAFKVITEKAANALEIERVSVWLFNDDRTKLQCISLYERSNQRHSAGLERNFADYPIYFKSLTSARIIAVTDIRTDLRIQELWDELLEPKNIVSLINTSIWVGGEVVGTILYEQVDIPWIWELSEQNFVSSIAEFVTLTLEVGNRKRAESALREAKEVAEIANRAKSTFLGNISHQLRTPLTSILEITEALQNQVYGPVNEEQSQSLNTLESNGKNLLELINQILELTDIESSKIELQLGTTSIQGLCDSSLSFVKHLAFQKKIHLSVQIPEELEPIQVDESRIRQVFINLLTNAIKFTKEGGKVWIEVQPNSTNEYIFFSVVDTGIGMLSDDLFQLFQPFVQVENSANRDARGSGLGLVMVQKIVELHGGTVHAESQLGKGSRFTVKLPWKKAG
ncbi:multi-sensor signal transduction histidine kinase [Nostoc commune NIES-4072]|uniref:histidine kinase n=1 Tax=Nostoc commune NIES-4072 TaxID=2005467 RepID=A0A2R5FQF7_NOSCO|nr:ATP-binding protein [Nostoc commune]BBD64633.1 multi-sensor signal transduction histidine kinase [Nostoc commune HK-02]GBG18041.1 multi-sensor signal transduction histidine kinase [Nostoc commune NIES-4072]